MSHYRSTPISLPSIPSPPIAIHVEEVKEIEISDLMGIPDAGRYIHDFDDHIEELMEKLDPLPPFPSPSLLHSVDLSLLQTATIRFALLPGTLVAEQLLELRGAVINLNGWMVLDPHHLALAHKIVGFRGRYIQLRLEIFPNGKPRRFPLAREMWIDAKSVKLGWKDRIRVVLAKCREPHFNFVAKY
ncbi:hypothetical protein PC9H_010147 [Pleurotus ostreatus]|uniref:Uncharacterized protein n=1 Tax=Pleurotus ostreatus TaxID=5322 RepID=A0A8H6ZSK5_PLEOS|nr:uncharacterized protein PC9H_010147 [Pleurotus ostreatus]KAF7424836.1 hypothetical protein PC9H_010147 [Pleurotus ostreatus]KAJ8692149.1 hypothetical protein PTI98_009487 [Pleurotus ostreatus]